MPVRSTSRQAYSQIVPFLGDKQAQVLGLLRDSEPLSNSEIAKMLGWEINRVTPRIKELRNMKLVAEMGRRRCHVTGMNVLVWGVRKDTLF